MPTRLLSPHLRRALITAVLLALVMTQTLGALHRALSGHATAHQRAWSAATAENGGGHFLRALFAGHHDEHDCKVFDQLAQADLAGAVAPAAAAQVPVEVPPVAIHPAWHLAAQAAGFLARGPPPRV